MKVTIAQLNVGLNVATNLAQMLEVLDKAEAGEWLLFPEGMLSGYAPERPDFAQQLDPVALAAGHQAIAAKVAQRQCFCVYGSAAHVAGHWYNSVFTVGPTGCLHTHHKIELAELDRRHFSPGSELASFAAGEVRMGVQACRELLFPQTWSALKAAGAQMVFHINNAVQPQDAIWQHVLITRAIEFGIFVASVNNCAAPQALPSYLISPAGQVLLQTACLSEQVLSATINPAEAIADLASRTDF